MKQCNKCGQTKSLDCFHKSSKRKDGRCGDCKECRLNQCKTTRENNLEEYRRKGRERYANNKEKENKAALENYYKNHEENKKRAREYYHNNKEEIKQRDYYNKSGSNSKSKPVDRDHVNKLKRKRRAIRIKTDPVFKLKTRYGGLLAMAFKRKGYGKKSKTREILGCDWETFKKHIEDQFEPWMSWDKHGLYNGEPNYGFDLDHIIPQKVT